MHFVHRSLPLISHSPAHNGRRRRPRCHHHFTNTIYFNAVMARSPVKFLLQSTAGKMRAFRSFLSVICQRFPHIFWLRLRCCRRWRPSRPYQYFILASHRRLILATRIMIRRYSRHFISMIAYILLFDTNQPTEILLYRKLLVVLSFSI
jgi:hypothetical protein